MTSLSLFDIAAFLQCPPPADADTRIDGLASLAEATERDLSYLSSEQYVPEFEKTRAAAIIVQRRVKLPSTHNKRLLVVDDAELAVVHVLERLAPPIPRPPAGIDATARVHPSAQLAPDVAIGPNVLVGARALIGPGVVLHAGVFIGEDVSLGEHCELFPHVVVRERITIGNRVIIHASSVLGTDGFGYRWNGHEQVKIPQIGTVIIEDDVEIGSCVCIDRAKFGTTRVGRGSKIDNLVQIGHNVQIGPHCIIVGQAGLAGSVKLGTGVVLGGQSAVRDHVTLGDGSMLAACSGVMEDVEERQIVSGLPALPHRQTLREQAALRRLPDLVVQVRKLAEEMERLKSSFQKG